MCTNDVYSTHSHQHSNDRETPEDDEQVRLASSDAVRQEYPDLTTGPDQQLSSATTPTDASRVRPGSHWSSSRSHPSSKKPKTPAETARSNLKRLSEAQEELESTSTTAASQSSSTDSFVGAAPPQESREGELRDLKRKQRGVALDEDGHPRCPERNDFPGLSIRILKCVIDVDIRNCVIILLDHSRTERSLHSLALRLQKELPESAFILVHALEIKSSDTHAKRHSLQAEAQNVEPDTGFLKESHTVLSKVINDVLIAKCHFLPRNIVVLGHCHGGTAALGVAASMKDIEFGGIISIGGALAVSMPRTSAVKAKTPALILSGARGNIDDSALRQIKEHFIHVEDDIGRISNDDIPEAKDIGILLDFFAHRFRGEEWTKQAVLSLDGGGIRGHGSLLIIQALMNKIGEEERRLDPTIESSFAPYHYKPMPNGTDGIVATATKGLPNSSLFLPCHYFTYVTGTSTGGLIGIMLSRFRMTVDDCIKEYKTLGAKVFGNPRPLAQGAILWHKFDCRTLEAAIIDVTERYSELGNFGGLYAMDEDACRCMVLAYADKVQADFAYRFRTYENYAPRQRSKNQRRFGTTETYGEAAALPIWQVARATSAAPTYFPPINISRGNTPGSVTFKDGGFGSNNPSEEAYYDIIEKHGGKSQNMGPFISIGTGIPPFGLFSRKKGNIHNAVATLKAAMKKPSRTKNVHRGMQRLSLQDNNDRFPYFRFDGGERLGEIAMDEWKSHRFTWLTGKDKTSGCITLEKMYVATAAYLADPEVQQDLTECARMLVRRRHLRMRNSSEWDRYASLSYYACDVEGCDKQRVKRAHDFREHLRKSHQKITDQEMERRVQECRRVQWEYRPSSSDPPLPAG